MSLTKDQKMFESRFLSSNIKLKGQPNYQFTYFNSCKKKLGERPCDVFPIFTCPVQGNLCLLQSQVPVLGYRKWNPMCSSAPLTHPPRDSKTHAFGNSFLLTAVAKCDYLRNPGFHVSSKQSDQIRVNNSCRTSAHWMFFCVLHHSRDCCV